MDSVSATATVSPAKPQTETELKFQQKMIEGPVIVEFNTHESLFTHIISDNIWAIRQMVEVAARLGKYQTWKKLMLTEIDAWDINVVKKHKKYAVSSQVKLYFVILGYSRRPRLTERYSAQYFLSLFYICGYLVNLTTDN